MCPKPTKRERVEASSALEEIFENILPFNEADEIGEIAQTCSTLREIATGVAKARALSLVAHFHSLGEVELSQAHALEVSSFHHLKNSVLLLAD